MKTAKEYFDSQLITDANSVIDKNAIKFSRFDLIRFAEAYAEYCHKLEEQSMDNYIANTEITPLTKDDFKQMDKEEMPVMPSMDEIMKYLREKRIAKLTGKGNMSTHRMTLGEIEWFEIIQETIEWLKSHSPVSVESKVTNEEKKYD